MIDINKYANKDKFSDFDIFSFRGLEKQTTKEKYPFVQTYKKNDSIFMLITLDKGSMIEKKFKKEKKYYYEYELKLTTDKDSIHFHRYFTKSYFLEYLVVKNGNEYHIGIRQVKQDKVRLIQYGSKNVELGPTVDFYKIRNNYRVAEYFKAISIDYNSFSIISYFLNYHDLEDLNNLTQISKHESTYYFKDLPYNYGFSPFWNIYLDLNGKSEGKVKRTLIEDESEIKKLKYQLGIK